MQHLGGHFAANHILSSIDNRSDPSIQRQIDSAYHKNALRCDFLQTFAFKKQYQALLFGLETKHCYETIMCTALGLLHQNLMIECKSACERAVQLVISEFADADDQSRKIKFHLQNFAHAWNCQIFAIAMKSNMY